MGVQRDVEDRSLPRPVGETGRRNVGNRKERWNIATMRVPRKIRISPSSFWAQRSAQPVGINKKVLSKCIRISIVASGMENSHSRASAPCDFLPSAPLRFLLIDASRMDYAGLPPKPA